MNVQCPKCLTDNSPRAEHCLQCGTHLGQSPSLLLKWLSRDYPKNLLPIRDRAHQARVGRALVLIVLAIFAVGVTTGWLFFTRGAETPEVAASLPGITPLALSPTAMAAGAEAEVMTSVPSTGIPQPTDSPTVTETPGPTNTPRPTHTPTATYTPVPTATPVPSATPLPIIPPGSVLLPGQTWYEDGLALTLNVSAITGDKLYIDVVLENLAAGLQPIIAPIDSSMVRLVANTQQSTTIVPRVRHSVRTGSGFTGASSMTLPQGERFILAQGGYFQFNMADPNVSSVTIEIVNLARIEKASFRVDIPR